MTRLAALLVAIVVGGAGCVFFDPINARPVAQVRKLTPGPHYRGERIVFQADKFRDPDGTSTRIGWRARACEAGGQLCDPAPIADVTQPSARELEVGVPLFRAGGEPVRAVRIELTVTDEDGAEAIDSLVVDILNRAPTLTLQSQGYRAAGGGYPIGTTVLVIAAPVDEEGDPVALAWELTPPPGAQPGAFGWQPAEETEAEDRRLIADVPGLWTVKVTATDGEPGGTVEQSLAVLVQPDQPPCLAVTDPVAQTAAPFIVDAPRTIAVRVVMDDLDPFPTPVVVNEDADGVLGVPRFFWFAQVDGGAMVALPSSNAAVTIDPAAYAPGQRLRLRVEVVDRVPRGSVCDPSEPTCSLGNDACLQRASWELEIR